MNKPLVSVVIPTYKRHDQLLRLLESIKKSDYPANAIEVVIVDNASDLEPKHIKDVFPQATIVRPGINSYSNGARRRGTAHASGEYIFHIDDDNVLDSKCISALVEGLEKDPELGVVGPVMLVDDTDKILSIGARISSYGIIHYIHKDDKIQDISLPEVIYGFDYLHNAIMVRRSVLEKISFDDINFPHNWAETDFGLRVGAAGYKMACISAAIERHFGGYDGLLTRIGPDKTYDQAKSRILFRRRHMSSPVELAKFWAVVFPISSLVYFWAIMRSPEDKLKTLGAYIRGTRDGILTRVEKAPTPEIGQLKRLANES
jgi:GT2 family glycosyltransferase